MNFVTLYLDEEEGAVKPHALCIRCASKLQGKLGCARESMPAL